MTGLCFVDANVLVYLDDPRDTRKRSIASEWLDRLWTTRLGRTSTQVLSEYFVTATRKLPNPLTPEAAWENVRSLSAWDPVSVDFDLLERAYGVQRKYQISWWDSLIVAAAELQRCETLLTEDLQDGASFGDVTVRNPFTWSVSEAAATYEAAQSSRKLLRRRAI